MPPLLAAVWLRLAPLAAAAVERDHRTVQEHGRTVLCSDLTDPAQCSASNASFCADAPVLANLSCDTFAACTMEDPGRPTFAYYSPGDSGAASQRQFGRRRHLQPVRKNEAVYCAPNGSFGVRNPRYFLAPFCADGFQIVSGGVWPPAQGGWTEAFPITGLGSCTPRGACPHGSSGADAQAASDERRRLFNGPPHPPPPPTCTSAWVGITGPLPSTDENGAATAAVEAVREAAGPLCALSLELLCGKEEKEGVAQCLVCAGQHASSLHKSCTEAELEALCKAAGPKPPPPPPLPPPSPPGSRCEFYVYANMSITSCFHACLSPEVALAAGIAAEQGTCEKYGWPPPWGPGYHTGPRGGTCQTNTEETRLYGNLTAVICGTFSE
jgi:hypothetical protein